MSQNKTLLRIKSQSNDKDLLARVIIILEKNIKFSLCLILVLTCLRTNDRRAI